MKKFWCFTGIAALAAVAFGQSENPDETPENGHVPPPNEAPSKKTPPPQISGEKKEPDLFEWIDKNVFKKILVSGSQRFALRLHHIEGNEEAFNEQWNRGRSGNFVDDRSVTISGKNVLGVLNFDVQLNNSPYGLPTDRRISLNYDRGWLRLDAGDINARLPSGNELVRFSRSMKGAQATATFGPLSVSALYTQSRSAARTISLTGNNTPGPYYLQAGMIVDGSLRVQVDGVEQRLGQDYTVNIYGGTITFERPIPPTSTIVCTYETMGYNQNRGDVYGAHVAYKVVPGLTIGATHLEQRPRVSGGLMQTTEAFQGYGPPNTPYFLLSPPLRSQPIIVTVDGVLQVEGVDYYFDALNPQIFYFTRFMPPTSIIRVTYTPTPDPGTFGNGKRQVSGVDFNWQIAKNNSLSFAAARSRLETPVGVQTGNAMSARYKLELGKLSFDAHWMQIPSSYVSVESTGFGRNVSGVETRMSYRAGAGWDFGLTAQDIKIATPRYTGQGLETISGHNRDIRFTANHKQGENQSFYVTALTSNGEYNGLTNQTQGVQTGYRWSQGKLGFDLGIGMTQVRAPNSDQELVTSSLYGGRLSANYQASTQLNFSAAVGLNAIRSENKSGFGRDVSLRAEWTPNPKLRTELVLADTNSGAITGIGGYTGGHGFGYNGNGFSGGGTGFGIGFGNTPGNSKVAQLRTSWNPSSQLSLDLNLLKTEANGDNLSNSSLTGGSIFASWAPSQKTRLTGRIEHMTISFTSQPGTSNNLIYGVSVEQDFLSRWRLIADYSYVSSSGSGLTGFDRTVNSVFANLTYAIDPKQRAFAEFRKGAVSGYLPDRESYFGIGYSYDILSGVALKGTYRFRLREAESSTNASYRSHGLDLELEFRFGGR